MTREDRVRLISVMVVVAVAVLPLTACIKAMVAKELKKDPYHKTHFPPTEPSPIDGAWVDPWGSPIRIEEGRSWDDTENPQYGKYPKVHWKDITRVAPGQYRAVGSGWASNAGEPITISVVSETQIIARLSLSDRAYTCKDLDDRKWFMEDFKAARNAQAVGEAAGVAAASGDAATPTVEIIRVETSPAALTTPGSTFDLEVDYRVNGGGPEAGPVSFSYAILRGDELLMESQPVRLEARPGEAASRTVNLKATSDQGTYTLRATIVYAGESSSAETMFLIGSRDLLLDMLAGEWLCRIGQKEFERCMLTREGDRLVGNFIRDQVRAAHWDLVHSSTELVDNRLVLRSKESSETLGCWHETETVFEIDGNFDELTGTSKITNGNWCVRIGETFNVTFVRVKE